MWDFEQQILSTLFQNVQKHYGNQPTTLNITYSLNYTECDIALDMVPSSALAMPPLCPFFPNYQGLYVEGFTLGTEEEEQLDLVQIV